MTKSMTGFGRSELATGDWTLTWEVKSVNSRYLDIKWRMPHYLRSLETSLEKTVREFGSRGRLDLSLNVKLAKPDAMNVSLNTAQAKAMLAELSALADDLRHVYAPNLDRLLTIPSLWQDAMAEPDPALAKDTDACLREALALWDRTRLQEGKAMEADMRSRLEYLGGVVASLKERIPAVVKEKNAALTERVKSLLEQAGAELSEERMLQEIAILADRLDVSEEMTRLNTHLDRFAKLLDAPGEKGKRLDFLLQEIFREITTCGNKCQDSEVSKLVVDFKAELEKCREQVQNIE